jgi:AAA+ ATPase superfamily predicted ATPase
MQKQLLQCNRIGRWWSNDNAIDIVALDDDTGTVWFGECKWSNKKAGGEIYTDLVKK